MTTSALEIKDFLENITLVLSVGAVTAYLFHKLNQPVVLGYILAGMIVGPHIPIPLIADSDTIHTLSELGIILLIFSLGLEFSIQKLFKVIPIAGLIALIECTFMMWLGYTAGQMLGWTNIESLYAGAILTISSTTIIVKTFSEIKTHKKLSEIVYAILIVEDLIAIIMLAGLPVLTHQSDDSGWVMAKTAGTLFMFLLTFMFGGLFIIPRVLRKTMQMNRPEITLIVAIGICFAFSLLAKKMGYSIALGAFIAGSLMAETGKEGYLISLIRPVRDIFAAIFFVSVGMTIDLSVIPQHWGTILLFAGIVLFGKFLGVMVGSFLAGSGSRLAIQSGLSLTQIGEFSFIIASMGATLGVTQPLFYPLVVVVSAMTTMTTPLFVKNSDWIATQILRIMPSQLASFSNLYESWIQRLKQPSPQSQWSHIKKLFILLCIDTFVLTILIIAASLSMNTLISRVKTWLGFQENWAYGIGILITIFFALPFCVGIIRCIRSLGSHLALFVLPLPAEHKPDLALSPRRTLTITLQLGMVLLFGMPVVAITQPFFTSHYGALLLGLIILLLGYIFWRDNMSLQGHISAGYEMVLETIKASLQKQKDIPIIKLDQLLPGMNSVYSLTIPPASSVVGQSLADLNFREITGATVIAIARKNHEVISPTGREKLEAHDLVSLTGTEASIALAQDIFMGDKNS